MATSATAKERGKYKNFKTILSKLVKRPRNSRDFSLFQDRGLILFFTWSLLVIFPSVIKSHPEYTAKITSPSRQHRVTTKIRPGTFIHTALKHKHVYHHSTMLGIQLFQLTLSDQSFKPTRQDRMVVWVEVEGCCTC